MRTNVSLKYSHHTVGMMGADLSIDLEVIDNPAIYCCRWSRKVKEVALTHRSTKWVISAASNVVRLCRERSLMRRFKGMPLVFAIGTLVKNDEMVGVLNVMCCYILYVTYLARLNEGKLVKPTVIRKGTSGVCTFWRPYIVNKQCFWFYPVPCRLIQWITAFECPEGLACFIFQIIHCRWWCFLKRVVDDLAEFDVHWKRGW